ncbi:MAG: amidohydrolase [Enterococcus sp.]
MSDEFYQKLTALRQHLHQHPELSLQEYQTTDLIKEKLQALGIPLVATNLKTGVVAELGPDTGITIGLRADIDALPITEATTLTYRSLNPGVMHACGHDFHTASLLGAAALLKQAEHQLTGKIRFIFQPAEENFSGAKLVIADGHLNGLDALVGLHNNPSIPIGSFGIREQQVMASVDRFTIKIKGAGSHAASPHLGSDPIVTASQLISQAQAFIPRHVNANQAAILSFTQIHAGTTWNVIPEEVFIEGTLRTYDKTVRKDLKQLIDNLVEKLPAIYQQTGTIDWISGPPALHNDAQLTKRIRENLQTFAQVIEPPASLGGEDFAFYQKHVPTFFALVGAGSQYPLHHPAFTIDDRALVFGVEFYYQAALTLIQQHTLEPLNG